MFIMVSGISGAGKTTLIRDAIDSDKQLVMPPSVVTREKRRDDNIDNYIYFTHKQFKEGIKNNIFLEYQKYYENYYGCLLDSYDTINNSGKIAIRDMAYEGIVQIKEVVECSYNILIETDFNLIEDRLIKRGDSIENIKKRIKYLEKELDMLRRVSDYILYNNESILDSSEQFKSIIKVVKEKRRF